MLIFRLIKFVIKLVFEIVLIILGIVGIFFLIGLLAG